MNRKIILKWKIRKIVKAIKKYDSKTQNESILQIKNVLHNVCVSIVAQLSRHKFNLFIMN